MTIKHGFDPSTWLTHFSRLLEHQALLSMCEPLYLGENTHIGDVFSPARGFPNVPE